MVDREGMDVYARPDAHSQSPPSARQEPGDPIFTGTPAQVAAYLGERMQQRSSHTINLVAAELSHLERVGWENDSLTFVLLDDTSVTVRP
jgi:hypothetical protein